MACWGSTDFKEDEINGTCEECGEPTVYGEAYENCSYSSTECKVCGWSPCDQSC